MNLLLLETATAVCSVGVIKNGLLVIEQQAKEDFQHASHLSVFIQAAMAKAKMSYSDLQYVALSHGPGSYTSLRVGAATAKGLCAALPYLQLLAIDTLSALAKAASQEALAAGCQTILPCIESRKNEVYTRACDAQGRPLEEVRSAVFPATTFEEYRQRGAVLICGSGSQRLQDHLGLAADLVYLPEMICRAAHLAAPALAMAQEGRREDLVAYEPLYLQPPFVTTSTKKLL